MTKENLKLLSENPKGFLNRCKWHEANIKSMQEQIQRYRNMAYSITAALKDTPSSGGTLSNKIEKCVIGISSIEQDIQEEIQKLRDDLSLAKEAIDLIKDDDLKRLLTLRYLQGGETTWEEIAVLMHYSYRWTLRLHGKALKELSKEAAKVYTELVI